MPSQCSLTAMSPTLMVQQSRKVLLTTITQSQAETRTKQRAITNRGSISKSQQQGTPNIKLLGRIRMISSLLTAISVVKISISLKIWQ